MAGAVFLGEDLAWSANSWVFYWTVDRLAELVEDEQLAEQLREVSQQHLGALAWDDVRPEQLPELLRAVRAMPGVGAVELPESEGREAVLDSLRELADQAGRAAAQPD